MNKKPKVFEDLERLADLVPVSFHWTDKDIVIRGVNQPSLKLIGDLSYNDLVGKSPRELYSPETAEILIRNAKKVMATKKTLSFEESVADLTTGKTRFYITTRSPLFENGEVIGIVGTSVETTAEKEAAHLKLENELQKNKLHEQEKFKTLAAQVAHDIRSPLASLLMVVKSCEANIPEVARIVLREAAINIGDIANNLLNKYKSEGTDVRDKSEESQPIILSLILLQLLTDKKYQYKDCPVKFTNSFVHDAVFATIKVEPLSFKRMISNLINNAVDAIGEQGGTISLELHDSDKNIIVSIKDNGKGMPQEIIDKIMSNIAVSYDKTGGHGIGFAQILDTLRRSNGVLAIDSKINCGTKIMLTFPKSMPPAWLADKIKLTKEDTVIILDDDTSIHGAWDARFKDYTNDVVIKHFSIGKDAIDFINTFTTKNKIFLLADYELLNQEFNGLHVIEKTGLKRSILVTSHYANQIVRNFAAKTGTKILPKQLASEILIQIEEGDDPVAKNSKNVDLVVVDDNKVFADSLASLFEDKNIDIYYHPAHFLEKLSLYAKDTKICLDNDLGCYISGIDIAKQLHDAGYTNLYMLSGTEFKNDEIPDYLTVIMKTDIELIKKSV